MNILALGHERLAAGIPVVVDRAETELMNIYRVLEISSDPGGTKKLVM